LEKTNRPTVRELLERIAENVDGIEPKDRLSEEKKAQAIQSIIALWMEMGYEKPIGPPCPTGWLQPRLIVK